MRFKINGERNSGTNFLWKLLETNFGRAFEQTVVDNRKYYWKHAIPDESIKNEYPGIVDVFVIRDLNNWLVSMYENPYHLIRFKDFQKFLKSKQSSKEKQFVDAKTNKIINLDDNNKTIFEIRYYKINKIFDYLKKQDNIIIVNLAYLQNEKICNFFLEKIKETFDFKPKVSPFEVKFTHTKSKAKNDYSKNRSYNIDIEKYTDIINKNKNDKIENTIKDIFLIKHNKKIQYYDVSKL